MLLFSQRHGLRPVKKALQLESIDDELRNKLWNMLKSFAWDPLRGCPHNLIEVIVKVIWHRHFKKPIDSIPSFIPFVPPDPGAPSYSVYWEIREYFFTAEWWQVYDFIEFIMDIMADEVWPDWARWVEPLERALNSCLESENAAYRIVGHKVVPITDEHEIEAIETALDTCIKSCQQHISRAIELLSDREQPDYRNSIKESISAVESVCRAIAGKPKATLGDCLKVLSNKAKMHQAFVDALTRLYGYTSDASGIRHSLIDQGVSPSYADAKFMLVSCCAFVNFLLTKASEAGIEVQP